MPQQWNGQLVEQLATDFPRRRDVPLDLGLMDGLYSSLLGIRSYWNFARMMEGGYALDLVRGMTLTPVATPTIVPYPHITSVTLNGSTQYLYRADEAALDILGNETYINSSYRGMTIGAWIRPDTVAAGVRNVVAKRDAVAQYSFYLRVNAAALEFAISNTGAAWVPALGLAHTDPVTANAWHFVCGRFDPSTNIDVNLDGVWVTTAAGVPATIYNGTAPFTVGAYRTVAGAGAEFFDGNIANVFYAAADLPDYHVEMLRQWTRPLYGI